MSLERGENVVFDVPPPDPPRVVRSTDEHSVEYHAYLTTRLFRAVGVAEMCDQMFYRYLGGKPGLVEVVVNDPSTKVKSKINLMLTRDYVYSLKKLAFNTFLALWDIKPEGVNIAQQVMDNMKDTDRSEVQLVDKIDDPPKDVPSTGMH